MTSRALVTFAVAWCRRILIHVDIASWAQRTLCHATGGVRTSTTLCARRSSVGIQIGGATCARSAGGSTSRRRAPACAASLRGTDAIGVRQSTSQCAREVTRLRATPLGTRIPVCVSPPRLIGATLFSVGTCLAMSAWRASVRICVGCTRFARCTLDASPRRK